MQMTEAMVVAPTMADTVALHEPIAAEVAASVPGAEPVADPVVPSKKRQFVTTVTVPVKRTLRSAAITSTPTLTVAAEDADGSLSSIQSPGFTSLAPTVPKTTDRATLPSTTAPIAASTAVNNRGDSLIMSL
ncbi:hypothetical protein BGZ97_008721 [Linnemannia gamsii]|uniref:Uncharacterized protein n=1 Tax=Linnemannia gamsii TaxID=64522 RepID=A0A9P6R8Q4_9FUNG|nr:hypothetical protein BGZ97_008721 [Linnemannia gamsii]